MRLRTDICNYTCCVLPKSDQHATANLLNPTGRWVLAVHHTIAQSTTVENEPGAPPPQDEGSVTSHLTLVEPINAEEPTPQQLMSEFDAGYKAGLLHALTLIEIELGDES